MAELKHKEIKFNTVIILSRVICQFAQHPEKLKISKQLMNLQRGDSTPSQIDTRNIFYSKCFLGIITSKSAGNSISKL